MNLKIRFERAMSNSILRVGERKIIDFYKTIKLYKYYGIHKGEKKPKERKIIAMIDGKIGHGGLSDRFWGILSIYKYCKDHNVDFGIYYKSPYNLTEFLLPNKYNWEIDEAELTYDLRHSKPRYISLLCFDYLKTNRFVSSSLKNTIEQQHVYTNTRTFPGEEFSNLFFELFKFTPELHNELEMHKKAIGGKYVSITFRFQQLLGDFKEKDFRILTSDKARELLIHRSIKIVESIVESHQCPVLVTSDSCVFLDVAKQVKNVYVIPGRVVHVDFCGNAQSHNVHLKSFIDLFMLANANKVYLAYFDPLYRSSFPETAAYIGNKPYVEISEPIERSKY